MRAPVVASGSKENEGGVCGQGGSATNCFSFRWPLSNSNPTENVHPAGFEATVAEGYKSNERHTTRGYDEGGLMLQRGAPTLQTDAIFQACVSLCWPVFLSQVAENKFQAGAACLTFGPRLCDQRKEYHS